MLNAVGLNSGKVDFYGHPKFHPMAEAYYSQTAYRYGDYVAKFAVIPANPSTNLATPCPFRAEIM